jgi:hypothetical protein
LAPLLAGNDPAPEGDPAPGLLVDACDVSDVLEDADDEAPGDDEVEVPELVSDFEAS